MPLFVNLTFTLPAGACGRDCLPRVEFHFDQGIHKRAPEVNVTGTTASVSMPIESGDRYGFVVGLWRASHPAIGVTTREGVPVPPEYAGISPRPDISDLVLGQNTTCECSDASVADCNLGDHYSNGLSASWSLTVGLHRLNAWTYCQYQGGG
jgi:hypothetical protein